ncbi:MAG TPA: hypothetical protein VF814_21775 [Casimicrobiaceae bacterium]
MNNVTALPVLALHHATEIEDDGKTLMVTLDIAGGRTAILSLPMEEVMKRAVVFDRDGRAVSKLSG